MKKVNKSQPTVNMKEDKPGRGGVGSGLAIGEEVISPLELLISRSAEVETLLPFFRNHTTFTTQTQNGENY